MEGGGKGGGQNADVCVCHLGGGGGEMDIGGVGRCFST
jgi:hypothetical protein